MEERIGLGSAVKRFGEASIDGMGESADIGVDFGFEGGCGQGRIFFIRIEFAQDLLLEFMLKVRGVIVGVLTDRSGSGGVDKINCFIWGVV